ncbi:MAG: phage antirepressor KilAC domain-containing protein [Flavonifractor plautii]
MLSSTGAIATTQIAADYDISAKQLNKILHEEGLQHCVNGQWILYRRHMGKGYTKSETIPITRSDGRTDTRIYTKWTQKGRILIHEILRGGDPGRDGPADGRIKDRKDGFLWQEPLTAPGGSFRAPGASCGSTGRRWRRSPPVRPRWR